MRVSAHGSGRLVTGASCIAGRGEDGARRITLGSAALTSVEEARSKCLAIESDAWRDETERISVPTFGEFVAGPGQACIERCKPSTLKAVRWVLNAQLLPAFGSLPLDRITPAGVNRWFDEYSRTAPGGGQSRVEPASPNSEPRGRVRPSSDESGSEREAEPPPEAHPLSVARGRSVVFTVCWTRYDHARPSRVQQADVIRLLLLTGCRRGEILTLRWQDIDGDTLNLVDAKTGPRRVFLNAPARAILERQPRLGRAYVFPSPVDSKRPLSCNLRLWYSVRREAEIEDVRLHDLRHTYASHAVLQGIPLPVVSRLLGHKHPSMTLRYAHVGDKETEAAAERVGVAIASALKASTARPNST